MAETLIAKTYTIRVPERLDWELNLVSAHSGESIENLITIAVAEKLSRLEHEAWLRTQDKTAEA